MASVVADTNLFREASFFSHYVLVSPHRESCDRFFRAPSVQIGDQLEAASGKLKRGDCEGCSDGATGDFDSTVTGFEAETPDTSVMPAA